MSERLRVGVIGCGLVAQVMHLPYLRELSDLFEIAAVCDLSPSRAEAVGDAYGVPMRMTRWEDVVDSPLDAVFILTTGSHAPIATAAVRAGLDVFIEKPLCLSVQEGCDLVAEVERAGVVAMVGYMKRFDPAYERLLEEMATLGRIRSARITTFESPLDGYVAHYPFVRSEAPDPSVLAPLIAADAVRTREAIGDVEPEVARVYREWMLDSMIHELNAIRGLLGEPRIVEWARIRPEGITAILGFGEVECVATWTDLPGMARYRQEWAFAGSERRALLELPSPFLRSAPSLLVLEDGAAGSAASSRCELTAGYDEAFKRELVEFHAAVTEGRPPRTPASDALRDIALCTAIVAAHVSGGSIVDPTAIGMGGGTRS